MEHGFEQQAQGTQTEAIGIRLEKCPVSFALLTGLSKFPDQILPGVTISIIEAGHQVRPVVFACVLGTQIEGFDVILVGDDAGAAQAPGWLVTGHQGLIEVS